MSHILSKAQFTQLHISKVPQKRSITHPTTQPLSPSKLGRFNWTHNPKNSKVTKARLPPASFPFFLKCPAAAGSRRRSHAPLAHTRLGRPRAQAQCVIELRRTGRSDPQPPPGTEGKRGSAGSWPGLSGLPLRESGHGSRG